MGDVVEFGSKREQPEQAIDDSQLVFVCPCECTTFRLIKDGTVQCANCGTYLIDDGQWIEGFSNRPINENCEPRVTEVVDIDCAGFVSRRHLQLASELIDGDRLAMSAYWDINGTLHLYSTIKTTEQQEVAVEYVENLLGFIKTKGVSDAAE